MGSEDNKMIVLDNIMQYKAPNCNKNQTIDIDGLFIAVGQIPENGNFARR